MKDKKTLLIAAAIVLMLVLNLAATIIIVANKSPGVNNLQDDENVLHQQDTSVSPSTAAPITTDWKGWQHAAVVGRPVQLCSDAQLSSPAGVQLAKDAAVVICEKQGDSCLIRSESKLGWVPESALSTSGDPVIYTDAAQITEPDDISETAVGEQLDKIAENHRCVGVQIAIINSGRITHHYEYGYQDKSAEIPVSIDTKIRVASISKVIVGMGVMSMRDMGVISIDEDVSKYWGSEIKNPEFPDDPITFKNIFTHTSSLTDFGYKKRATSALVENLSKKSSYMKIKPGDIKAYDYNNSAMCAAGAIAGRAGNINFDQYIREYFFAPLGIDASFHANNIRNTDKISVVYNNGVPTIRVQNFLDFAFYGGPADDYSFYSGGMLISACDYAKLVCILLNDGEYDQMYYLTQQSIDQMLTAYYQLEDYDQCLVLRHRDDMFADRSLYYHNGNMAGVYSMICLDPETGDGMVIISNGSKEPKLENGVYSVCGELAEAAVQLWGE